MDTLQLLQISALILGTLSLFIAGIQDRRERKAPAIYLTPLLLGFAINPIIGLFAMAFTILAIITWKDKWNETVGLADFLLFITVFICLTNDITRIIVLLTTAACLADMLWIQPRDERVPVVWIFAKWLFILLSLKLFSIAVGVHG